MKTERSNSITSIGLLMLCVAIIMAAAMIRGGSKNESPPDNWPWPYSAPAEAVACCACSVAVNGDYRSIEGFMMMDTSCECPLLVVDLPEN